MRSNSVTLQYNEQKKGTAVNIFLRGLSPPALLLQVQHLRISLSRCVFTVRDCKVGQSKHLRRRQRHQNVRR